MGTKRAAHGRPAEAPQVQGDDRRAVAGHDLVDTGDHALGRVVGHGVDGERALDETVPPRAPAGSMTPVAAAAEDRHRPQRASPRIG